MSQTAGTARRSGKLRAKRAILLNSLLTNQSVNRLIFQININRKTVKNNTKAKICAVFRLYAFLPYKVRLTEILICVKNNACNSGNAINYQILAIRTIGYLAISIF